MRECEDKNRRKEKGGRKAHTRTRTLTHNEARLTMALLSSGCCHLVSRHQLTGQLLLSSASTQTPGLIKPQPRHSPINHLMMSYHGDHWAASVHTHTHREHISANAGRQRARERMNAHVHCAKDTHLHRCAKIHTVPPLVSISSSMSWRCEKHENIDEGSI